MDVSVTGQATVACVLSQACLDARCCRYQAAL
jgi:hypothetical protein